MTWLPWLLSFLVWARILGEPIGWSLANLDGVHRWSPEQDDVG